MTSKDINIYVEQHRQEAIDFLVEMLQTPSPTGKEMDVSNVAEKWMKVDNLPVERHFIDPQRPNLVAVWEGNSKGPRFLFNGHLDVFPPTEVVGNNRNPWSGEIIDGSVYARGSVDMKAGLSAGIMAVKLLKRSGFIPKGTIIVSCDCDEEQGGLYGVKHLIGKDLLRADFGVCMEASEDCIVVSSDGRIEYKITYTSDSWHAGTRVDEDDALRKATRAIDRLYAYDQMLKAERYISDKDGGAILSVTKISAGTESNMHPTSCTFYLDRRYTNGETVESATKELQEILDNLKAENPLMDYKLEIPIASPKLSMDPNHPLILTCIDAYKDVFGKKIALSHRCAGGDASKITEAYGFPLPHFGPGKYDQLCTPDEHVEIEDYIGFIKVYMNVVVKLLS